MKLRVPARGIVGALVSLAISACSATVPARAPAGVDPVAIAGYYEGIVQSRRLGEIALSANLLGDSDSLFGTLITPFGDFPLVSDSVTAVRLVLRFVTGDGDVGLISAERSAEGLLGSWTLSDDGGTISLRRTGPPRAPVATGPARLDLSPAEWREDLRFLAAELPRTHGNAFHTVSRGEFEDSVRALDARLAELQGHQVFAAMARAVALVGDGHTYLQLPETFGRYPFRLYAFGDTLRIVQAVSGYEELLGARVLAIGGMHVGEAIRRVQRQIASGENEWYVLSNAPGFLTYAEVLHAHGIVPDTDSAAWTVVTTSGERRTITVPALPPGERATWRGAAQSTPVHNQRPGEDLWFTLLPDSRTLYVGFRGYPPREAFREFWEEVLAVADQQRVERLVIDLRQNGGGDFTKTRELLLPQLRQNRLNQRDRLYVVIGRRTFSAAMTNAADFLTTTNATLVGEPTGARPNGWQEMARFTLPHSRLAVSVSTQYYRFLNQDAPAVFPHQHIPPTWEDYRAGRDAALEWIIAQPAPPDSPR